MLSRPTIRRSKAPPGERVVSTLTQFAPTGGAHATNDALLIGILIGEPPIRIDPNPLSYQRKSKFKSANNTTLASAVVDSNFRVLPFRCRGLPLFNRADRMMQAPAGQSRPRQKPHTPDRNFNRRAPRLELTLTPCRINESPISNRRKTRLLRPPRRTAFFEHGLCFARVSGFDSRFGKGAPRQPRARHKGGRYIVKSNLLIAQRGFWCRVLLTRPGVHLKFLPSSALFLLTASVPVVFLPNARAVHFYRQGLNHPFCAIESRQTLKPGPELIFAEVKLT